MEAAGGMEAGGGMEEGEGMRKRTNVEYEKYY